MDRHRGDYRSGNLEPYRSSRMSRWSSSSPSEHPPFNQRYPPNPRNGGFSTDRHLPFDSPPSQSFGGAVPPPFRPMSGGGFGLGPGHAQGLGHNLPLHGQKRGRGSPDISDGGNFAKLFVGSVPRTATEDDIRPFFEEHGNVAEVALIKDKRTGQQQGCCFVKYTSSSEADRAIRALHNQFTLPGGLGPIQVRYADGERPSNYPSTGAVEHKLFVGSMNKQATEREIEEVFCPYGRVEDVYIMKDDIKQSRGCGFVKFSQREMAEAAIRALNGTYVMRGCDQPLTVRFADPKRPRAGEPRFSPAFGGPGFGPRSQEPLGIRPIPNVSDSLGGRYPTNSWQSVSPKKNEPSTQVNSFGNNFSGRDAGGTLPSPARGSLGVLDGSTNGSLQALPATQPLISQQRPIQSPHRFPSSLPNQQHLPTSMPQTQSLHLPNQQLAQLQLPHSLGQNSLGLALPSHALFVSSGQLSASQPQVQQVPSAAALHTPLNISTSTIQQHLVQPIQPPSQISQSLPLIQQQVHPLPSSFQSSQLATYSQMHQQLHPIQTTTQSLQLCTQTSKPQTVISSPESAPVTVAPSSISATSAIPVGTQSATPQTCNWTEHTSPEGYKYYYNSVTTESRWEKPDELTLFEQQQKLQQQHVEKLSVPQLHSQQQIQLYTQIQSTRQPSEMQHLQPENQLWHQQQQPNPQMQLQSSLTSPYQASGGMQNFQALSYAQYQAPNSSIIDSTHVQKGPQASQDWMWKKTSGN